MNIIIAVVVGAVAGYLASIIVGTNKDQGCIADIVVGLVGSGIANFLLLPLFPGGQVLGPVLDPIIFATAGAVILLFALQILMPGRRRKKKR